MIYDAEDRPDPDQLKKALIAFKQNGEEVAVVQAALNYFNDRENPLTRMFTLEYSYWFDYMLPGLEHDRLPIPLGGTSNHFRVDALREVGVVKFSAFALLIVKPHYWEKTERGLTAHVDDAGGQAG